MTRALEVDISKLELTFGVMTEDMQNEAGLALRMHERLLDMEEQLNLPPGYEVDSYDFFETEEGFQFVSLSLCSTTGPFDITAGAPALQAVLDFVSDAGRSLGYNVFPVGEDD